MYNGVNSGRSPSWGAWIEIISQSQRSPLSRLSLPLVGSVD